MFKYIYQDGAAVEVFSAQGKDPVAKWKLYGGPSSIYKVFDKEVKGFVYSLEGSSQTVKMQMPVDGRIALGLRQRFLVLQVNVPQFKDFSIELLITDSDHLKRRLYISTVYKEVSATPLHAKIPFVAHEHDIWSNLCIDLLSFTGELFKSTGFPTLDGITVSANCKLRRIFTMKTEPMAEADDMFSAMDMIPRSCQFLPDVFNVFQVLNMECVRQADVRTALGSTDNGQPATARSASSRRPRMQGSSHIAFGTKVSGPPRQTGRKNSESSEGRDGRLVCTLNTGPNSSASQKGTAEHWGTRDQSELSNKEPCHSPHNSESGFEVRGRLGKLQPHPPKERAFDRNSSKKLRIQATERERLASSDILDSVTQGHVSECKAKPMSTARFGSADSRQLPLSPAKIRVSETAEGIPHCPGTSLRPVELQGSLSRGGLGGCDPQAASSPGRDSDEESEPQLLLREELFTFSSVPHSARRRRERADHGDHGDHGQTSDCLFQRSNSRHGAEPEDDFVTSESDEDEFHCQKLSLFSSPATPRLTVSTEDALLNVQPGSQRTEQTAPAAAPSLTAVSVPAHSPPSARGQPAGMVPTRCLSPSGSRQGQASSASLCRRSLREVSLKHSMQLKGESNPRWGPVSSQQMQAGDEEEELRMLASLRREQEQEEQQQEEEEEVPGLSQSQIHQCNVSVSVSMSSDDTSTWTLLPVPTSQGHHYQNEMNPLLHSNPREWMDLLSPPIIPSSQREKTDRPSQHHRDLLGERGVSVNKEEDDEYLNLLYDPCLNCYFDPQTGKYYELA